MPTQEEIKAKRNQLKTVADQLIFERDVIEAKIKAIWAEMEPYCRACGHPNGYATSCMGDPGFYCPDCGYSR